MEIKTHYLKNNDFKTVQGNGVFGGLTNTGQINMSFYTDRAPIPETVTLEIDETTGSVIREVGRESKNGIIREVHFGVLIDIDTAKSIIEWLNDKVAILESNGK